MRRREFMALGGAAMAWPSDLCAQSSGRPVVGVLSGASQTTAPRYLDGFAQGLKELGYVDGENVQIAYSYADGIMTRMPMLAVELIRLRPSVVVVGNTPAALAIRQASADVLIVGAALGYADEANFAASRARPGGQVTGLLGAWDGVQAKQIQLMLELVPVAQKIGLLINADNPAHAVYRRNVESAAATLVRKLVPIEVRVPDELDRAFQAFDRERVEFGLVLTDPMFISERRRIASLAGTVRVPIMYGFREHVEDDGLISYGIDLRENYRRAATYVDRILKGARPGELALEFPTKFELVINLRTAKSLGLTVPPTLLARADELIE
jgi:putative tryptophan/tyrosine transport system substrate-binding protein